LEREFGWIDVVALVFDWIKGITVKVLMANVVEQVQKLLIPMTVF